MGCRAPCTLLRQYIKLSTPDYLAVVVVGGDGVCPEPYVKYLGIIFELSHRIAEIIENILSICNYGYLWNSRHVPEAPTACKTSA